MTKSDYVRLEMARAVRTHLTNHATLTTGVVGYAAAFQSFCEGLDTVELLAVKQGQRARAAVQERNNELDAMIDSTLALAGAVAAIVDPIAHSALLANIKITPSDFQRSRISHRVHQAQHVCASIRTALPVLEPLGIAEATVAGLQAKINAAAATLPNPRTQVVERKAAKAEIVARLRRLEEILTTQIDPMMRPFRKTHREFLNAYKAARMIVDRRGRRVADGDVSQPLAAPAAPAPATQLAA